MTRMVPCCLICFGVFAFAAELLEDDRLRMAFWNPAGEGVGEKDSGAMLVCKRSACGFQQGGQLQVGDDEGRGHDLKAEDTAESGGAQICGTSAVSSPAFSSSVR